MTRVRVLLATAVCALSLSACTPSYHETLEVQLAGLTPQQKRAFLARECGQEIHRGATPGSDKATLRHFERMRAICEEMTGHTINAFLPPT